MANEYTLAPGLEYIVILENEYILASYSDGRYSIEIDDVITFATSAAVMPTGVLLTMPNGTTIAVDLPAT